MSSSISSSSLDTVQTAFRAADYVNDGRKHLLLAASGSVATIKITDIVNALKDHANLSIRLILTKASAQFLGGQSHEQPAVASLLDLQHVDAIFFDEDEWSHPWKRGNPILHIELRRWAHLLVIAPLSANTLAKITGGFSDNLLTSVVRAWDTTGLVEATSFSNVSRKRILVAPAMNTAMWKHPITQKQVRVLEEEWGVGADGEAGWFEVLRPQEKALACGDVGDGAMKNWQEVVSIIESRMGLR